MKYVRITNYVDPYNPPVTVVIAERDLESEDAYAAVEQCQSDGFFVTYEVFESDDPLAIATVKATARIDAAKEHNMAIGYFYWAAMFPRVVKGGAIIADRPTPLSREDVAWVFRSLAARTDYDQQRITALLADGTLITLADGEVLPA